MWFRVGRTGGKSVFHLNSAPQSTTLRGHKDRIFESRKGKYTMSRIVLPVFLLVWALGWNTAAFPQTYPDRPIQLIVPNVPGSIVDVNARLLTGELGENLGARIVVQNRPGAASTLGTAELVRSRKDGYTIGYLTASSVIYTRVSNPATVPYDPEKELEPLGCHVFVPTTVAVLASSPWKTFPQLIEHAGKNPGKLRVSTLGLGAIDHFNCEIVQSLAGVEFTLVPFRGGESVITALLGAHVDLTFDAFGKVIPHVEAGRLRILLVSRKMPGYSGIPTATELGYPQELLATWFAFFGPAGMPEGVKQRLVSAIEKAVAKPELRAKVEKMGYLPEYRSPEELGRMMRQEYGTASAIARRIGLQKGN